MTSHKDHKSPETAGGTRQASDRDAAAWDIPYSRARFEEGERTESVGNPSGGDEMGEARERPRRRPVNREV